MKSMTRNTAAVLMLALLFTGCTKKNGTDAYYKENPDDKVTLVIGTDLGAYPGEKTVKAVNDYLKDAGCSYTVYYFIIGGAEDYNDYYEKYSTPDYAELIAQIVDSGEPLDICYAPYMMDNYYKGSYDILSEAGYFYPLNDYLYSEDGRAFYDSIPTGKWASLDRNGNIYGVNAYPYNVFTGPAYIINNKILVKYGYSVDDFNAPIEDIKELMLSIQSEENRDDFYCLNFYMSGYGFPGLFRPNSDINGIVIDDEENVISLLESDEYIGVLNDLWTAYKDENIRAAMSRINADDALITVCMGGNTPMLDISQRSLYNLTDSYSEADFSIVYPYGFSADFRNGNACNCILNSSTNKKEALDFLERIYTDKKLSDLVIYGREDIDYKIIDGKTYTENDDGTYSSCSILGSWKIGNGFICTPSASELSDKQRLIDEYYSKIEPNGYAGFFWDASEYMSEVTRTNEVIDKLFGVFEADDFDTYIEELKKEFERAGGDVLLESAKAELGNWKNQQH